MTRLIKQTSLTIVWRNIIGRSGTLAVSIVACRVGFIKLNMQEKGYARRRMADLLIMMNNGRWNYE